MKLFIQPNDVLFFRDGRPFDAGGDHVARLQFPPNPVTFYGAIRAALIGQLGSFQKFREESANPQLKEVIGYVMKKEERGQEIIEVMSGSLMISDFGLGKREGIQQTRLFPIPLDITQDKDKETKAYFVMNPEKADERRWRTNLPRNNLCLLSSPESGDKILESPSGFLTEEGLKAYLSQTQLQAGHFIGTDEVFQREYRVGIERSIATMTAEEGQLYSIEFARLHANAGFCVEVTGMNGLVETFKQHTLLRLGGESRSACYQETTWDSPTAPAITNGRFKAVLLTPAIFSNGWIPDSIDATALDGTIAECSVKLIAAAVGRPVGIGGWDIVKRESKPMRRAVPAGSVYYFECLEKGSSPAREPNGFIHIGEEEFKKKGLGQAIIGTWNYIGGQ
jgi:CRISPR-associated protein Cmr3